MNIGTAKRAAQLLCSIAKPQTAVILGTGLDIMEEALTIEHSVEYTDIPGFAVSSVASHAGKMIFGRLGQCPVVVMSGRFHLYEGYSPQEVTFPVRVFKLMGVKRILISNAAGGLRKDLVPGSTMLITDHINFTGRNPLVGKNNEEMGPRFPDMTRPYSPLLLHKARDYAKRSDLELKEGVYVQVLGPSMETAAETRMLKIMGADAVGMSTVMEVNQAVHCGMEVMAISAITNNNDPDDYRPAPIEEVISMAKIAGPAIAGIFSSVLNS